MEVRIKAKVTSKVDHDRPPSPLKATSTNSLSPPTFKPKAKINSSATPHTRKPGPTVNTSNLAPSTRVNIATPLTRASSPFKSSQPLSAHPTSAGPFAKAKLSSGTAARAHAASVVASPSLIPQELRQRAHTVTPSDATVLRKGRERSGSGSSHVSSTSAQVPVRSTLSPPTSRLGISSPSEDGSSSISGAGKPMVRVKSKVSRFAEHGQDLPRSVPSSPSYHNRPTRVPSISNLNLSLSPPLNPADGTRSAASSPTSVVFARSRFSPGEIHAPKPRPHPLRPSTPRDETPHYTAPVKLEPAFIPLPPQSPPISTLSFSSRSSVSRSSLSHESGDSDNSRETQAPRSKGVLDSNRLSKTSPNGFPIPLSRLEGLGIAAPAMSRETSRDVSSPEYGSDYDNEGSQDRKLRAEAKSNRKIADLEITNRSLMAINSSLEATKHRQAQEIRDLKRKLRESLLVLPPQAFRAAKSSLSPEEIEEDDEEDDQEEEVAVLEGKTDESYRRVRSLIEGLIETGKHALETKPEDFVGGSISHGKVQVLSEEEARTWRGEDDNSLLLHGDISHYRPLTPSRVAVPDDDDDFSDIESGAGGEASPIISDNELSPLPPITVTPSPSP